MPVRAQEKIPRGESGQKEHPTPLSSFARRRPKNRAVLNNESFSHREVSRKRRMTAARPTTHSVFADRGGRRCAPPSPSGRGRAAGTLSVESTSVLCMVSMLGVVSMLGMFRMISVASSRSSHLNTRPDNNWLAHDHGRLEISAAMIRLVALIAAAPSTTDGGYAGATTTGRAGAR